MIGVTGRLMLMPPVIPSVRCHLFDGWVRVDWSFQPGGLVDLQGCRQRGVLVVVLLMMLMFGLLDLLMLVVVVVVVDAWIPLALGQRLWTPVVSGLFGLPSRSPVSSTGVRGGRGPLGRSRVS